jgi:hypothetical protein
LATPQVVWLDLCQGYCAVAWPWRCYRDELIAKNFLVLTFDPLGQGSSDKPSLFIDRAIRCATEPLQGP